MPPPRSAGSVTARLLVAALAVTVSSACAVVELEPDATDQDGFEDEVPEVPQPAEGASIPLEVSEGPLDGSLLFVPVTIDGQGPFSFVLDTGASNTTIDAALADELELPETGVEGDVTGVTGDTIGTAVEVESWQLGDVELDASVIVAVDLGGNGEEGIGVDGLLGSDVLSGFGIVTVDYDEGILLVDD
jgi:predicted aspartyl protease